MSNCSGCGAGLPPDAAYCPRCGVPVAAVVPQLTAAGPPSPWASPDSTVTAAAHSALPEAGPLPANGPLPVAIPLLIAGPGRRPPRQRWLVPVVIVALLFAAALTSAGVVAARHVTPQSTAEAYLDAIAQGDAKAALALRASTEPGAGLLTTAALHAAGVARPTRIRVTAAARSGTTAKVTVGYLLDGLPRSLDLTLRRTRTLPVPVWRVDSPLGAVEPAENRTVAVTVAGVRLGPGGLSAFPARYPVRESDPAGFFESATAQVTVADRTVAPGTELNLSPDGKTRIVAEVQAAERQCLAGSRADCPFENADLPGYQQVGFDAILTEPSWNYRVTAAGVDLITTAPGLVSCTTRTYDGGYGRQSLAYRADAAVALSGTGEVTVSFT